MSKIEFGKFTQLEIESDCIKIYTNDFLYNKYSRLLIIIIKENPSTAENPNLNMIIQDLKKGITNFEINNLKLPVFSIDDKSDQRDCLTVYGIKIEHLEIPKYIDITDDFLATFEI